MEQAADTAEAAVVDYYFSSPAENISVSVCLQTPENRLMIVLWCAFGLPGDSYSWGRNINDSVIVTATESLHFRGVLICCR